MPRDVQHSPADQEEAIDGRVAINPAEVSMQREAFVIATYSTADDFCFLEVIRDDLTKEFTEV